MKAGYFDMVLRSYKGSQNKKYVVARKEQKRYIYLDRYYEASPTSNDIHIAQKFP